MKISPEAMQRLYKVLNSDTPEDPIALGVKDMVENYGYEPNLINDAYDAFNVIKDTDDYYGFENNTKGPAYQSAQAFANVTDEDLLNKVAGSRDSAENLLMEMYDDMQTTGAPIVIPDGTSEIVDNVINADTIDGLNADDLDALNAFIAETIGPSQMQMYFPEFNKKYPGNVLYGLPPIDKLY